MVSDLGLHCLPLTLLCVSRYEWANKNCLLCYVALTLLHSELLKLSGVLAVLSAIGLKHQERCKPAGIYIEENLKNSLTLWTQNCTNSYGVPFNEPLHQVSLTFKCQTSKNSKTGSRNVHWLGYHFGKHLFLLCS